MFDAIEYDETDIGKTYSYTIVEMAGTELGMTYDDLEVTVTVTVTDLGDGVLDVDVIYSDDTEFNNTYAASGNWVAEVTKSLLGRDRVQ